MIPGAEMLSLVLAIAPNRSGVLPRQLGRAVLAEMLRHIGEGDAQLAAELHNGSGLKPFTCSGLLEEDSTQPQTVIARGNVYHLRITALTDELCRQFMQHFVTRRPTWLRLQEQTFEVQRVFSDGSSHVWAGSKRYGDLVGQTLARAQRATPVINLEFVTPAAFRTHGMTMPFPLPGLVFGSLLERWNAFSPLKLELDIRRIAESEIAVSSFELASAAAMQKCGSMQIGAYGRVKYRYLGRDRQTESILNVLAAYAQYGGVGIKTTMGMGQCRGVYE